jgi:hypothetical protein
MIWGSAATAYQRRLKKLHAIEDFMPSLLASDPIRPLVELAGQKKECEIFITREAALENDTMYRSFEFTFESDKDDLDPSENISLSAPRPANILTLEDPFRMGAKLKQKEYHSPLVTVLSNGSPGSTAAFVFDENLFKVPTGAATFSAPGSLLQPKQPRSASLGNLMSPYFYDESNPIMGKGSAPSLSHMPPQPHQANPVRGSPALNNSNLGLGRDSPGQRSGILSPPTNLPIGQSPLSHYKEINHLTFGSAPSLSYMPQPPHQEAHQFEGIANLGRRSPAFYRGSPGRSSAPGEMYPPPQFPGQMGIPSLSRRHTLDGNDLYPQERDPRHPLPDQMQPPGRRFSTYPQQPDLSKDHTINQHSNPFNPQQLSQDPYRQREDSRFPLMDQMLPPSVHLSRLSSTDSFRQDPFPIADHLRQDNDPRYLLQAQMLPPKHPPSLSPSRRSTHPSQPFTESPYLRNPHYLPQEPRLTSRGWGGADMFNYDATRRLPAAALVPAPYRPVTGPGNVDSFDDFPQFEEQRSLSWSTLSQPSEQRWIGSNSDEETHLQHILQGKHLIPEHHRSGFESPSPLTDQSQSTQKRFSQSPLRNFLRDSQDLCQINNNERHKRTTWQSEEGLQKQGSGESSRLSFPFPTDALQPRFKAPSPSTMDIYPITKPQTSLYSLDQSMCEPGHTGDTSGVFNMSPEERGHYN